MPIRTTSSTGECDNRLDHIHISSGGKRYVGCSYLILSRSPRLVSELIVIIIQYFNNLSIVCSYSMTLYTIRAFFLCSMGSQELREARVLRIVKAEVDTTLPFES